MLRAESTHNKVSETIRSGLVAGPPAEKCKTLLDAALAYTRRGLSIIPTRAKKPRFRWKQYQRERAHADLMRDWFGSGRFDDIHGIAVVCGPVSGGLSIRDFDDAETYHRWAGAHPDLAATLPTVRTARGYHVYCRADLSRIIRLGDGELRGAGYCVLPPSRHPSGITYRWTVPLSDCPLPIIDLNVSGLMGVPSRRSQTQATRQTQATQDTQATHPDSLLVSDQIIIETLPTGPERSNVLDTTHAARVERTELHWVVIGSIRRKMLT
jgi:hypothetical protein